MKMHGLALVPAAVLLAVSYFVLFAQRKVEAPGLKIFGYVVTAVLWLAVLGILALGGHGFMKQGMCPMDKTQGPPPMCPMMQMMQEQMKRAPMSMPGPAEKDVPPESPLDPPGPR